jgi:hypothetical protein
VNAPFDNASEGGPAGGTRRPFTHRAFWQSVGLLLALAVAWLVFRAYRQPDFLIDLVNLRLC